MSFNTVTQTMDAALLQLLPQIQDAREATEAWLEIIVWAEGIYRETGRPATLDDLYRDLPDLRHDEEYDDQFSASATAAFQVG